MPSNIEIKVRLEDLDQMRQHVRSIADQGPQLITQKDVFFSCRKGRLKLRRFADGSGQLIAYSRPDSSGPKTSLYEIASVSDCDGLERVLDTSYGRIGVVEKTRELFIVGQTRIHLDVVKGLGAFLELEVVLEQGQNEKYGHNIARDLMSRLAIASDQLIECAYLDLLMDPSTVSGMLEG